MLADIERKVLRIICNYEAIQGRTPNIEELCVKTGRDPEGIHQVLTVLNKEKYISWDHKIPDNIAILERWERM